MSLVQRVVDHHAGALAISARDCTGTRAIRFFRSPELSARARDPARLEELLQRLAAERRHHVGIRDPGRARELLEAEEAGAVVHQRAPVAAADQVALVVVEARVLHGRLWILGKPLP